MTPKDRAQTTCRELLKQGFVILDVETSGLDSEAECLQIGVVSHTGEVLLSSYIKPVCPIDEMGGAFSVNGISNAMVADAQTFPEIWEQVCEVTRNRFVVAYNADFDTCKLLNDRDRHKLHGPYCQVWQCAMKLYSNYAMVPGRRGFKWFRLADACRREGIEVGATHEGVADCLLTLELVRRMAR